MWRQEEEEPQSRTTRTVVCSSSSKSSSSSSSPSPSPSPSFPFASAVPQTPGSTMEEVWKDISLTTTAPLLEQGTDLPYYPHVAAAAAAVAGSGHSSITGTDLSHLRGAIFQDFLGRPRAPEERRRQHGGQGAFAAPVTTQPPPVLTLNSGVDSRQVEVVLPGGAAPAGFPDRNSCGECHGTGGCSHRRPTSSSSITTGTFSDALGSPACPGNIFSFCNSKKRATEQQQQLESSDGGGDDRRHKRMIKNRESAARSRARKQAYTNELELEVNHLTVENEKLRRKHEELRAKLAAQLPKKKVLQRSSTAPF